MSWKTRHPHVHPMFPWVKWAFFFTCPWISMVKIGIFWSQGTDPDLVVVAIGAHLPSAIRVARPRAQGHPQRRWLTDPGSPGMMGSRLWKHGGKTWRIWTKYGRNSENMEKWRHVFFFGCVCDFVFIIYLELTMNSPTSNPEFLWNSRQPAGELIYVPNAGCAAGFKRSCPKIVASWVSTSQLDMAQNCGDCEVK